MKRIFRILPLLFLVAPAFAADAPLSLTNSVKKTVSGNPGGAGEVSAVGKLPRLRVAAANKGFVDAAGQRFTPCGGG